MKKKNSVKRIFFPLTITKETCSYNNEKLSKKKKYNIKHQSTSANVSCHAEKKRSFNRLHSPFTLILFYFLFPFKFPSRRYGNMSLVHNNHKLPTVNPYSKGKVKARRKKREGTNKQQKVVFKTLLCVLRDWITFKSKAKDP